MLSHVLCSISIAHPIPLLFFPIIPGIFIVPNAKSQPEEQGGCDCPCRLKNECSVNFTDLIGKPNHAVKGSIIYLPNAEGRASPTSTIATASAAPCVLLLLAYHIAESASKKIDVIIMLPPIPPMDAVPPTAARMKK